VWGFTNGDPWSGTPGVTITLETSCPDAVYRCARMSSPTVEPAEDAQVITEIALGVHRNVGFAEEVRDSELKFVAHRLARGVKAPGEVARRAALVAESKVGVGETRLPAGPIATLASRAWAEVAWLTGTGRLGLTRGIVALGEDGGAGADPAHHKLALRIPSRCPPGCC